MVPGLTNMHPVIHKFHDVTNWFPKAVLVLTFTNCTTETSKIFIRQLDRDKAFRAVISVPSGYYTTVWGI